MNLSPNKSPVEPTVEVHAIVSGRVQGVGFRATVQRHAKDLCITGTVHNLPDNTVEIYAQGTHSKLSTFLHKIREEPGLGYIHTIDTRWTDKISQPYTHFSILKT